MQISVCIVVLLVCLYNFAIAQGNAHTRQIKPQKYSAQIFSSQCGKGSDITHETQLTRTLQMIQQKLFVTFTDCDDAFDKLLSRASP